MAAPADNVDQPRPADLSWQALNTRGIRGDRDRRPHARRAVILLIAVALLVGAWQLPSPTWACGWADNASTCVDTVALRPVDLAFDPKTSAVDDIALSPDGAQVLVAFRSNEPGTSGRRSGALLVFDVESGTQVNTIVQGEGILPTGPHYSTDAGMIAVWISTVDPAELRVVAPSEVHVFDAHNGSLLYAVEPEAFACPLGADLSFSLDGEAISCGATAYVRDEGASSASRVGESARYGDFNDLDVGRHSVFGRAAWTPSPDDPVWPLMVEYNVDSRFDGAINFRRESWDRKTTLSYPHRAVWEPTLMGLNGEADRLVLARTAAHPWWFAVLPRMLKPPGDMAVIDVDEEAFLETIDLAMAPEAGAWSADGSTFALLDKDLRLSVFAMPNEGPDQG
ncbi:MAG: hypothetical protein Q4P15_04515 [Propionibacteriaceae bacterium]|nr:hypothetical protein [Propionibacteriaceae bacterium]